MLAHKLVRILLNDDLQNEATVRLPPRGHRWIGVFTGPEPGQQIWRSTRLTDRDAALALARRWEADSLRQRRARWRAGRAAPGPSGRLPGLTQAEVAVVMRLSERAVRAIERRAVRKLRQHPLMRSIWAELRSASPSVSVEESVDLNAEELAALLGLVESPEERHALMKVLTALWGIRERPPPGPR